MNKRNILIFRGLTGPWSPLVGLRDDLFDMSALLIVTVDSMVLFSSVEIIENEVCRSRYPILATGIPSNGQHIGCGVS